MPAQTAAASTVHYTEGDTNGFTRTLLDTDGSALDLSAATAVTIRIGYARYSHYYSPYTVIVDDAACSIDADPTTGKVTFTPASSSVMSPPGTYHYSYRITWSDGTQETVPEVGYESLVIQTRIGGQGA